jgi:hypothetical protein
MPFIRRDSQGKIIALYAFSQAGAEEELPLDHPEVLEFLRPDDETSAVQDLLAESDRHLSRVVEDLITLLAEQNIIRLTDLPREAQQKLLMRKNLRHHLIDHGQVLVDDDDLI